VKQLEQTDMSMPIIEVAVNTSRAGSPTLAAGYW
jgi:hypothetical protein